VHIVNAGGGLKHNNERSVTNEWGTVGCVRRTITNRAGWDQKGTEVDLPTTGDPRSKKRGGTILRHRRRNMWARAKKDWEKKQLSEKKKKKTPKGDV